MATITTSRSTDDFFLVGPGMGVCAALWGGYLRLAERAAKLRGRWVGLGRYPGGLAGMRQDFHRISPDCPFVSGAADVAAIVADRRSYVQRAAESRVERPVFWAAVTNTINMTACTLVFAYIGVSAGDFWNPREGFRGNTVELVSWLVTLALLLLLTITWTGANPYHLRAMRGLAHALGGGFGVDDVDPVVDWLARRWSWYSPPSFLSMGNTWAEGTRQGHPVLLIAERSVLKFAQAAVRFAITSLSGRGHARFHPPDEILYRLSVFIPGVGLRSDDLARSHVSELYAWGYGVVETPVGLYMYTTPYERALQPAVLLPILDKLLSATSGHRVSAKGT